MNVFTAVVRLGGDPEQRYTASGDSVVNFNAAVDSGFGDKKVTTWLRCNMWGKRGESVLPYLSKGSQVAISGELSNREYTDKEGQKKMSLEVRINELTLIGGKQSGQSNTPQEQEYALPPTKNKPKPSFDDLGDDIPF